MKQTYIVFLRGVNVSGARKLKMAELKVALTKAGFGNVVTYIQSGNIVLTADNSKTKEIEKKVSEVIASDFGYTDVPVKALTHQKLKEIVAKNPFSDKEGVEKDRLYFTFLADVPSAERVEKLNAFDAGIDEFVISENVVYLHCPVSYGNTKLNNNFFEARLNVAATTRNWKTSFKMLELSENI